MPLKMKFSKSDFAELDFPDLFINFWSYAGYMNDPIVNHCQKWCFKLAKERWLPQFLDFEYVIKNLKEKNKNFYNFGRISNLLIIE